MLKVWNLSLIIIAFSLTIFGTFLTRSGILSSIHAFSSGPVGGVFLVFLAFVLLSSFGLLAYRSDHLKGQPELDSMVSRESAFVLNNIVLVSALFTIFLGTIFPLISEALAGVQVSVGGPYFNSVTVPLFLLLVFLMGVGPIIAWRRASWDNLKRNFLWPSAGALILGLILFAWKVREFWPLLGFTLLAFVVFTIAYDTALALRARRRIAGEGILRGLITLARRNQRRYGGFVVHLGVVLIVLGIAGSMTYSIEREATLALKEHMNVGNYVIQFEGLKGAQQPTHYRVEGAFRVSHAGDDMGTMSPALKFFPTQQAPIGRAVHRSSISEDVYLILSGFSELNKNQATLKVLIRPLLVWIWIGGFVIFLGTLLAILPLGKPAAQEE
jgi:cytochrome c-type biogenesis protein CcmF